MSVSTGTDAPGQEPGAATTEQGQEPAGQQQGQQGQEQGQEPGQQSQTGQQGQDAPLTMEQVLESIQDPNMKAYLTKVSKDAEDARREAAKHRTAAQQAQQQATELQRQNETDAQRVEREQQERTERLEALERENRDLKVGTALTTAAEKAQAFNPTTVANLLNAKVELDDDGKAKNVDDLLADLKRSDPYLFRRATADAGAGTGQQQQQAPAGGGMNDFIRGTARAGR